MCEIEQDFQAISCYYTTPKHLRSILGFFYIYLSKGTLILDDKSLTYSSTKGSFIIPLNKIIEIKIGHYSRIQKPVRLDYISIKYRFDDVDEFVIITPALSSLSLVWETNKIVSDWMNKIRKNWLFAITNGQS